MTMRFNTVEDLTFALLNEIGLAINTDGILYDTENNVVISVGGKSIKCSVDPRNPAYNSAYSVVFDPINNMKLMMYIFSYYTTKEEAINNISTFGYSIEENKSGKINNKIPSKLIIRVQKGTLFDVETRFYYNKCLKFTEAILKMGEYDVDLSNFDRID